LGGGYADPVQQPPEYSSIHDPDLWSSQEPSMSTPTGYDASSGAADTAGATQPGGTDHTHPLNAPTTAAQHPAYSSHSYAQGAHEQGALEPPKGPKMSTVAWGLVLILLGLVVIAVGLGIDLQLELVFIGILGIAGLTLLVGSFVGAGKRSRD